MADGIGRVFSDGEVVVRQGDEGNSMYAIQSGCVEIVKEDSSGPTLLGSLGAGEVFGEMAILEKTVRSATVRAKGETRILTIDRRTFLRRVQEDPTIAINVLRSMARRVRRLDARILELQAKLNSSRPGEDEPSAEEVRP